MNKYFLLPFALAFVCLPFFGQSGITNLNSFRSGDKLKKQQIAYKDPGRSGENVVWDFSRQVPFNDNYIVRYITPKKEKADTIRIYEVEHQTKYKYDLVGDSLLLTGFENSGSFINYSIPQLSMKYPFLLGDSINSSFSGAGIHENVFMIESVGTISTKVDATGTLILPNDDTIKNAFRVKTIQVFIQSTYPISYAPEKTIDMDSLSRVSMDSVKIAETDSIYLKTESFKWFVPGYRYPVFETIMNRSHSVTDTTSIPDIATSFYFPPSQHSYLENDEGNMKILDSIQAGNSNESKGDSLLFKFNYFPNPLRTFLSVELLLDNPSNVSFRVSDLAGHMVFNQNEGFLASGMHYFSLNLNRLQLGEYVLYILVNDQIARATLMKL